MPSVERNIALINTGRSQINTSQQNPDLWSARYCPPLSTLVLLLIVVVFEIPARLYALVGSHDILTKNFLIAQLVLEVCSCIVLSVHCVRKYCQQQNGQPNTFQAFSLSHCLQVLFCSMYALSSIVGLFGKTLSLSNPSGESLGIDKVGSFHTEFNSSLYNVIMHPLLLGVIFSDALREVVWILWAVCLLAVIVVAGIINESSIAFGITFYSLQSIVIFYSIHANSRTSKLKELVLRQNQEIELAKQDMSMKQMMANVAHDLKTPLSSIMTGIDTACAKVGEELRSLCANDAPELNQCRSILVSLQDCFKNMSNTNHFVIMSINRCIQYTKASKGLKLTPELETIDLRASLALPPRVMQDVQDKVQIEVRPWSETICPFVITDKQWLQENVLCLLSNAAKYSNGGLVTLSLFLEEKVEQPMEPDAVDKQHDDKAPCLYEPLSSRRAGYDNDHTNDIELQVHTDDRFNNSSFSLRIEVEDQGIGMSEEAREKLFMPFQQNQSLAIGSTGLGLFSLRMRVEALGGQCGVSGRHDGMRGSLFWFTIPYRPDHIHEEMLLQQQLDQHLTADSLFVDTALNAESSGDFLGVNMGLLKSSAGSTPAVTSSTSSTSGAHGLLKGLSSESCLGSEYGAKRILLVDDSPSALKITTMLLQTHGFDVTTATNGAMALEVIETKQKDIGKLVVFDAILMDLQMPVMDGIEATKRLRAAEMNGNAGQSEQSGDIDSAGHGRAGHLVVGLSANSADTVYEETRTAGFDNFLSKPFQIKAFCKILKEHCQSF